MERGGGDGEGRRWRGEEMEREGEGGGGEWRGEEVMGKVDGS